MSDNLHYRDALAQMEIRDDGTADGATVAGIVVPYNEETDIVEYRPDGPLSYREVFRPGAFASICKPGVAHRVTLTYNHDESRANRLGYGLQFEETTAGLHGIFRLDRSAAEHATDILSTSHGAFSVGFVSIKPAPLTERAGALVERLRAALLHVAAVPTGFAAYKSALVGSMREALEIDPEQTAERETAALGGEFDAMKRRQDELDRLLRNA